MRRRGPRSAGRARVFVTRWTADVLRALGARRDPPGQENAHSTPGLRACRISSSTTTGSAIAPLILGRAYRLSYRHTDRRRLRIVQYEWDILGSGVEAGGAIFDTGYADTLSLIRDGERGLEAAAGAVELGEPDHRRRDPRPAHEPGKIFGSGVNYASHGDEEPGFVFPDESIAGTSSSSRARSWSRSRDRDPSDDDVIRRVPGDTAGPLREHGFAVDYEVEFGS